MPMHCKSLLSPTLNIEDYKKLTAHTAVADASQDSATSKLLAFCVEVGGSASAFINVCMCVVHCKWVRYLLQLTYRHACTHTVTKCTCKWRSVPAIMLPPTPLQLRFLGSDQGEGGGKVEGKEGRWREREGRWRGREEGGGWREGEWEGREAREGREGVGEGGH